MRCDYHPSCPGCPLIGLSLEDQLSQKQARLQHALAAYAHLCLSDAPAVAAAPRQEGYRHRLKLPVHIGQNRVTMGLLDPVSGRVQHTPDCPVLAPSLREAIPPLLAALHRRRDVYSVDLRVSQSTGQLQLVLAVKGGQLPDEVDFIANLQAAIPDLASVALSRADTHRRRVMGRSPRLVAGLSCIEESIGETRLNIFPGAFFQADPLSAAALHDRIRDAIGDADSVLDAYAGVGAYARMLAPGRSRVVAIEEVPTAAEAARADAPENLEVILGRVEDQDLAALGPFDAAILNPARRGSTPEVLSMLAHATQRLVYVSCCPETLARDLDILAYHGMRARSVDALDLFPQTREVEAIVTLERGPSVRRWTVTGGHAQSPWGKAPSGAVGRPVRVLALVIGDTGEHGKLRDGRYRRLGMVAGHSLLRMDLRGPAIPALAELARAGHPLAGRHGSTNDFFSERAGLIRPFLHVERDRSASAPLHGDLVSVLRALGASERLIARAGGLQRA